MYILRYLKDDESYQVDATKQGGNLISVTGDYPVRTDGFMLSREGYHDNWDYTEYTTIYDELVDGAIFSNDGSVKPDEPEEG